MAKKKRFYNLVGRLPTRPLTTAKTQIPTPETRRVTWVGRTGPRPRSRGPRRRPPAPSEAVISGVATCGRRRRRRRARRRRRRRRQRPDPPAVIPSCQTRLTRGQTTHNRQPPSQPRPPQRRRRPSPRRRTPSAAGRRRRHTSPTSTTRAGSRPCSASCNPSYLTA